MDSDQAKRREESDLCCSAHLRLIRKSTSPSRWSPQGQRRLAQRFFAPLFVSTARPPARMLPLQLTGAVVALCTLTAALPSLPQQQTFNEDAGTFASAQLLSADPAFDVAKFKDGGPPSPFPPTPTPGNETGHGHFSLWSRETKEQFLLDVSFNNAQDWTLVMGNEAGGE